jgi:hypothetical protein
VKRGGFLAVLAILAAVGAAVSARPPAPKVDLARGPQTVMRTLAFDVGDTYTLGSVAPPDDIVLPFRLTAIDVVHGTGIEVVGRGVIVPRGEIIGLVPDWPPEPRFQILPFDPNEVREAFAVPVLGIRLTAPVAGLRGIEVGWVDGRGDAGARVFDLAVVTCPGCGDDSEPALRELGLLR